MFSGIGYLNENDIVISKNDDYLKIPQNKVVFYDIVYKNVKINYDNKEKIIKFAAQYKEVLNKGKIVFEAIIAQVENLDNFFGHVVVDADGEQFSSDEFDFPKIDKKADFCLGKSKKIVNGLINN